MTLKANYNTSNFKQCKEREGISQGEEKITKLKQEIKSKQIKPVL